MGDPRIKADEATIAKSLQGHWREEHIFELTQALGLYRVYQDKIAQCDREIEAQLERFEDHSNGDLPAAKSGRRRNKGNAPRFDVWTHLYRMTGIDLTQIDCVDAYTALKAVRRLRQGTRPPAPLKPRAAVDGVQATPNACGEPTNPDGPPRPRSTGFLMMSVAALMNVPALLWHPVPPSKPTFSTSL